jgi:hypothetical protein
MPGLTMQGGQDAGAPEEEMALVMESSVFEAGALFASIIVGLLGDEMHLGFIVKMVTMGGDLQPGCLADQLLTGLGQPQMNP